MRSRLSQGGYTIQAAELDKEIYNISTLSKSFTTTPYFEMGIHLGTEDILDEFPTLPAPSNAWKTQQPENQLALLGIPNPNNDDQSLISNNDGSLANTLATFETNLTTVVTTMLELNNHERARERKEDNDRRKIEDQQRAEVEERREAQRKADDTKREQERRDEYKRMGKLEDRREEKRAETMKE